MKVSSIDIDVFQDAPEGWFSASSLTEGFRDINARLVRMVVLGLLERSPAPNEHCFRKLPVTDTCSRCAWIGTEDQMERVRNRDYKDVTVHDRVCPKCGCDSFYRLVKAANS